MSSNVNDSAASESFDGATAHAARTCPACGAEARREGARFCATCGRRLDGGYFPTDSLLASYHQQRRRPPASRPAADADTATATRRPARPAPRARTTTMPEKNGNYAGSTALAFVTYSLVPYLGILFCPGALLWGGVGLLRARRAAHRGGARASALSLALGLLVLCAQLLLWWILYKVPEWSRQSPF